MQYSFPLISLVTYNTLNNNDSLITLAISMRLNFLLNLPK